MGYDQATHEVHIYARLSRHNDERDDEHDALWAELCQRVDAAVDEIVGEEKFRAIDANRV